MHVVPNPSVICGVTPSLKLKRSNGLRPLLLADYGAYGSWRASRIDPAARRSVPQRQLDRNGFSFHWAGDGGSVGPFSCIISTSRIQPAPLDRTLKVRGMRRQSRDRDRTRPGRSGEPTNHTPWYSVSQLHFRIARPPLPYGRGSDQSRARQQAVSRYVTVIPNVSI
jgi:hypothetical protein